MAPHSIGRSSKDMLSWACSLESKKGSGGQSKGESWEEKDCREEEEEENIAVSPTTPEQDNSRRYWEISDCGI